MTSIALKFLLVVALASAVALAQYNPSWDSLDTRPLPQWYDDAKFGIFIHWGVFSVPSYDDAWMWYDWQGPSPKQDVVDFMKANYPPNFTYQDFAPEFQTEFYDPNQWADIFAASGAKYVVLTSKHHEGYTLWPSSVSWSWNAKDVGPKRDLLGDLANAIRNKTNLHFGLYHSLYEWFNPLYLSDKSSGFTNGSNFPARKTIPELYDIVNTYQPEVIWSDGDWEAPDSYWTSQDFIAWLYNDSPVKDTVVTNDRWGSGVMCNHGDFYTCADRYNPGTLQSHKWENCMTIDKYSWGYRRNAVLSDYMTIEELISTLASTVSCGGNLLMNVGPTEDGIIMPIFEERLREMGQWLGVNGGAIYGSKAWTHQNDTLTPNVWYTSQVAEDQSVTVYAIVLTWPNGNVLQLGAPVTTGSTVVSLLGYAEPLEWAAVDGVLSVQFPSLIPEQLPWAWVLQLEGVQ